MEIEIKTKEEYKEKYGKLWEVATELDNNFRNCEPGWAHINGDTIEPFYMDFPTWRKNESECQFNGTYLRYRQSGDTADAEWEYFPTDISKIDTDLSISRNRVIPPYGWFGGFECCIIDNTIFETVQYTSGSLLTYGENDSFFNQDAATKSYELFLPHLCHSRISNSNVVYFMGEGGIIGHSINTSKLVLHDEVRVGNASQYINCHVKINPVDKGNPNQVKYALAFHSCYFENCTFDIHKRSNVEFTNCVFV